MKLLLLVGWCWLASFGGAVGGRQAPEAPIHFQITNAGFTVEGTLSGLEARGQFDPAHLAQASIRASVPVSSLQTGVGLRDRHLQKADYFDAARYPAITLQSKSFRRLAAGQYEGLFVLTMKGVSHDVTLPFTVSPTQELRGTFRLNRLDYGVGKKSLLLANEVTISIVAKLAVAQ